MDDRVAFACMYLSDTKLQDYLKKLTVKLTDEGNLDGLLLTGKYVRYVNTCFKFNLHFRKHSGWN